jgi:hypothetical protein
VRTSLLSSREIRQDLLSGIRIRLTAAPELRDSVIMDMLSQVTAIRPAVFISVRSSDAGRVPAEMVAVAG